MKPPALASLVLALALLWSCAPSPATGALSSGVASAMAGGWDEAVRHWTKALEQDPSSAAAHNNLAVAYERRGAWEEARREYEEALRLDPDNRTIKDNYEAFKERLEAGPARTP